ncbi:MAG: energy transducer TonB, partial [Lentisphaerota bacterium]
TVEPPAPSSGMSQAVVASAQGESNYWQMVRTAVAGQARYPAFARRQRNEGYVLVQLSIDAQGQVQEVLPLEASSQLFLQSAMDAVEKASPFPPPTNCTPGVLTAAIPIIFRINQNKERNEESENPRPTEHHVVDAHGAAGRLVRLIQ